MANKTEAKKTGLNGKVYTEAVNELVPLLERRPAGDLKQLLRWSDYVFRMRCDALRDKGDAFDGYVPIQSALTGFQRYQIFIETAFAPPRHSNEFPHRQNGDQHVDHSPEYQVKLAHKIQQIFCEMKFAEFFVAGSASVLLGGAFDLVVEVFANPADYVKMQLLLSELITIRIRTLPNVLRTSTVGARSALFTAESSPAPQGVFKSELWQNRVMSLLNQIRCPSRDEIARHCGLEPEEIERCLDRLANLDLVRKTLVLSGQLPNRFQRYWIFVETSYQSWRIADLQMECRNGKNPFDPPHERDHPPYQELVAAAIQMRLENNYSGDLISDGAIILQGGRHDLLIVVDAKVDAQHRMHDFVTRDVRTCPCVLGTSTNWLRNTAVSKSSDETFH